MRNVVGFRASRANARMARTSSSMHMTKRSMNTTMTLYTSRQQYIKQKCSENSYAIVGEFVLFAV